jgi:hypothetical protein
LRTVAHCVAPQLLRHALRAFWGLRCRIIRSRRLQGLGPPCQHVTHPGDRIGLLAGEQVPVGVHRQRDRGVTHDGLDHFHMCARHRQPRAARVPQSVEVQYRTVVIHVGQEVALLAPGVFVGIVLRLAQPPFSGVGQIIPQHAGDVRLVAKTEHGSLRGLVGNVRPQICCKFRLDVLPGHFAVLRAAGLAGDVRGAGIADQSTSGQAAQLA